LLADLRAQLDLVSKRLASDKAELEKLQVIIHDVVARIVREDAGKR
jgi:hypothetical protein